MASANVTVPPVVDTAWVHDHADRVVLVDVRWYLDGRDGHAAYLAGHLPGAVWADVDVDLSAPPTTEGGRHPLPSPEDFAAALGRLGIADDDVVVGHDDTGGSTAARLVWLLRAIGRPAALLDGGIAAWDGPLRSGQVVREPVVRTAVDWPAERLATAEDVLRSRTDDSEVVLDARAAERYTGEAAVAADVRRGHAPGAASAPWAANLGPDGRFLPEHDLRSAYEERGVDAGKHVTAYCGSGVTACLDLLALERIGITDARLYPGSWSAWAADGSLPVVQGPTPTK